MLFFLLMLIAVVSSIAVIYKVLTAYVTYGVFYKISILCILVISWFAPIWLRFIRNRSDLFGDTLYDILYRFGYFMLGFVLILSMLIIARDILWYVIYGLSGKADILNPNNVHNINLMNVLTVVSALLLSGYGVWEAHQMLDIKKMTIYDERIKTTTRFVVASDLHINHATSQKYLQKMVDVINVQNPDYILLVGDIADDLPQRAADKVKMLSQLKAKKIYISLGNHEYYNQPYAWMLEFSKLNFEVLQNSGESIENTGIYIAGVPDVHSAVANYERALNGAENRYTILLSHTPADYKKLDKSLIDIQFSGHTHGGQIFPFQYLTQKANNGYLAGLYMDGKSKLFVMRGLGYWGPPMRIFAKPDIVVLTLKPKS